MLVHLCKQRDQESSNSVGTLILLQMSFAHAKLLAPLFSGVTLLLSNSTVECVLVNATGYGSSINYKDTRSRSLAFSVSLLLRSLTSAPTRF